MRFFAGLTKLANIPPDITMDTELHYFHFLFEAKDISTTTTTLGWLKTSTTLGSDNWGNWMQGPHLICSLQIQSHHLKKHTVNRKHPQTYCTEHENANTE